MPNHVTNRLVINASKEEVKKVRNFLRSEDREIDFNNIVPMPDDLMAEEAPMRDREKAERNLKLYGYEDWYDWRRAKWGTKWNAYNIVGVCDNEIMFDTAWNGIPSLIRILAKRFPNVEFMYEYADEDLGCNAGYAEFSDGEIVDYHILENDSDEAYELAVRLKGLEDDFQKNPKTGEWEWVEEI